MIKLAITGSIGMGKSTTAGLFAEMGIPCFDADRAVHELYAKNGAAVAAINQKFKGVVQDGTVDRAALSKHLQAHFEDFSKLEAIVHPLVGKIRARWVDEQKKAGAQMVCFDIPLFFENKPRALVDYVIVASASAKMQNERVLARPNMSAEKLAQILSRQMPDAEKRAQADYVVCTEHGIKNARLQVAAILRHIKKRAIRKPDR